MNRKITYFLLILFCLVASSGSLSAFILPKDTLHSKSGFLDKLKKSQLIQTISEVYSGASNFEQSGSRYEKYRGRSINKVIIKVIDPAGYSVFSPDINPDSLSKLQNFFNKTTPSTPERIIRKDVLVKEGDFLDPLLLVQSEMLLRQSLQYKDVYFKVEELEGTDWVNIVVIVQDRWAVSFNYSIGSSYLLGGLYFKNFLGRTHDWEQNVHFNFDKDNPVGFDGFYRYRNIANSRVNTRVQYYVDKYSYTLGGYVDRPFISPKSKWAGSVSSFWYKYPYNQDNPVKEQMVKLNVQDVWLATSIDPKFHSPSFNKLRFVIAGRVKREQYSQRPFIAKWEQREFFFKERFYLFSLGLANWSTYVEKDLYYVNAYDYLPKGFNVTVTAGVQYYERFSNRVFVGCRAEYGTLHKKVGYNNFRFLCSGYFDKKTFQQGRIELYHQFASRKLYIKKWFVRQIISNTAVFGINRPTFTEYNLNGTNGGLTGFSSQAVEGNNKYTLNLETNLVLPYRVLGFSASLFAFADLGLIWKNNIDTKSYKFGHSYGIGAKFFNPALGLDFISIGFVYYPVQVAPDMSNYNWFYSTTNPYELSNQNLFSKNTIKPTR